MENSKHTILLVDDEKNILKALKRTLMREDFKILTTESPKEALTLVDSNVIDLVISDYNMPEMSGIDLLKTIEEKNPNCVRFLLSGSVKSNSDKRTIPDDYLHCHVFMNKPWDDDQLKSSINDWLNRLK